MSINLFFYVLAKSVIISTFRQVNLEKIIFDKLNFIKPPDYFLFEENLHRSSFEWDLLIDAFVITLEQPSSLAVRKITPRNWT
ncbi:hypothetical protein BpHYR1_003026 [Brachionus plicatilis]|uniref:Uncharacterized protein n=1 Tax=Brachionus plicatilis TaxID=10195 RepID=A0A3M7PMZ2_BRAPC|nr:hypothetical protein BpHYR1_003026 [Brachionus plicatilis]